MTVEYVVTIDSSKEFLLYVRWLGCWCSLVSSGFSVFLVLWVACLGFSYFLSSFFVVSLCLCVHGIHVAPLLLGDKKERTLFFVDGMILICSRVISMKSSSAWSTLLRTENTHSKTGTTVPALLSAVLTWNVADQQFSEQQNQFEYSPQRYCCLLVVFREELLLASDWIAINLEHFWQLFSYFWWYCRRTMAKSDEALDCILIFAE